MVKIACNLLLSEIPYYLFKLRACRDEDDALNARLHAQASGDTLHQEAKELELQLCSNFSTKGRATAGGEGVYGRRCLGAAVMDQKLC